MNRDDLILDEWLTGQDLIGKSSEQDVWEPGFEGDRVVVVSRLGFYSEVFLRPQKFIKRFFHKVYPLPVADWQLTASNKLHGGFCTIDTVLDICFQPTLKYVESTMECLPNVNAHIQASYESLIRDVIDKELLALDDGDWVQEGLGQVERQIETAVNETLMIHNIQCRASCALNTSFEEIDHQPGLSGLFTHEPVVLNVLKKNHEFREKQREELFRQEEELEKQRLEHEQNQLELIDQEGELQRQKQFQESENQKMLLLEQEQQLADQLAIKQRLHESKIELDARLKEMERDAELVELEKQAALQEQIQADKFNHEKKLKEKELDEELVEFEKQQARWNQIKEQVHNDKLIQQDRLKKMELESEMTTQEYVQGEQLKAQERLLKEKLEHESKLKELELEAETKEHEIRYEATRQTDEYLRREIELLVLEKQRAELIQEIREAEQQNKLDTDAENNLLSENNGL